MSYKDGSINRKNKDLQDGGAGERAAYRKEIRDRAQAATTGLRGQEEGDASKALTASEGGGLEEPNS